MATQTSYSREERRDAGGFGDAGEELVADIHLLHAVALGKKSGDVVRKYVKGAAGSAKALLQFKRTVLDVK